MTEDAATRIPDSGGVVSEAGSHGTDDLTAVANVFDFECHGCPFQVLKREWLKANALFALRPPRWKDLSDLQKLVSGIPEECLPVICERISEVAAGTLP